MKLDIINETAPNKEMEFEVDNQDDNTNTYIKLLQR